MSPEVLQRRLALAGKLDEQFAARGSARAAREQREIYDRTSRFVQQVRHNWIIPQAAMMSMHGNVAITFVIHRDGRITDVTVARPSAVNAFTLSARNAILMSNPTIPLPPEYPDSKMLIMVTFYFNEDPPGR